MNIMCRPYQPALQVLLLFSKTKWAIKEFASRQLLATQKAMLFVLTKMVPLEGYYEGLGGIPDRGSFPVRIPGELGIQA